MRSRKQIYLSMAALLGTGLATGNVAASAIDMDSATAANSVKYAQEINLDSSTTLRASASGTLAVTVKSGYGVSPSSSAIWYRFDLSNAKFSKAPVLTVGTSGSGSDGAQSATVSTSADTYYVYNATANAAGTTSGGGISLGAAVSLEMGCISSCSSSSTAGYLGILPTSKAPIKLKYRVFTTSADAINGTNSAKTVEVTLADFAPAVSFGVVGDGTSPIVSTISATNNFGQFSSTLGADNQKTTLGKFWLASNNSVLLPDGSTPSGLDSVLDVTTTKLSIGGNFSSAASTSGSATTGSGVYVSSTDCATNGGTVVEPKVLSSASSTGSSTQSILLTPTSSGISTGGLGSSGSGGAYYICYSDVAGTAESILAGDYTLKLVPTAKSGFTMSSSSDLLMGQFKRDGTELQATFVAGLSVAGLNSAGSGAGGVNRFVFTNTGNTSASIVGVKVLNATSTTSATPIVIPTTVNTVIPANGVLKIEAADLLPAGTSRTAVVFTIGAESKTIKGTYQLLMPGSTTQSVVQMVPAGQSQ